MKAIIASLATNVAAIQISNAPNAAITSEETKFDRLEGAHEADDVSASVGREENR